MSSPQGLELELVRLTERYEEQPAGRVFAPLADCHRKLGQLDSALQICLTGLARHPGYSSAQLILGKIFLDRGEDGPAREALERVLELDGQNLLAMRLLAEMAERLGELDEAEVRWRQLAACEYDPELTEERLEAIAAQRGMRTASRPEEEPAEADEPVVADEEAAVQEIGAEAPDPDEAARPDSPGDLPAPDPAFEVVEEAAPAPSPVFPDAPSSSHTSEIATLTLAGIYAEQGFKAKALEIYTAIASRNPDLPGLQEKIDRIRSAMARVERDVVQEMGAVDGPDDEGLQVVTSAANFVDEQDSKGPSPSEPLFSDVPSSADPVTGDASRYRRFGTWLDRVKSDDED